MCTTLIQKTLSIFSTLVRKDSKGRPGVFRGGQASEGKDDSAHASGASSTKPPSSLLSAVSFFARLRNKGGYVAFDGAMSVAKDATTPNEDCICHSDDGTVCAIADGATVSYDSRAWAQRLASEAVREFTADVAWFDAIARADMEKIDPGALPWNRQAALERGSFSTLALVRYDHAAKAVRIFAVGDTIVFVLDGDKLVATFPYDNASQFDNTPNLICSRPGMNRELEGVLQSSWHGPIALDRFHEPAICIATDALAHWLFRQTDPGAALRGLTRMNAEEFLAFVERERKAQQLRIDDTTLLVMKRP